MRQLGGEARQRADLGFQARAFLAEFLGALRLVPDIGLFELALNFDQAM